MVITGASIHASVSPINLLPPTPMYKVRPDQGPGIPVPDFPLEPPAFPYEYRACQDPLDLLSGEALRVFGFERDGTAREFSNPAAARTRQVPVPGEPGNFTTATGVECIPLEGLWDSSEQPVAAGEYRHFHYVLTDPSALHNLEGADVTFRLMPCHGRAELFVKPQILWRGKHMWQMFETVPGSNGLRSDTWPFPSNTTGYARQGPDDFVVEAGQHAAAGAARASVLQDAEHTARRTGATESEVEDAIIAATAAADAAALTAAAASSLQYPGENFDERCWGFHGVKDTAVRVEATATDAASTAAASAIAASDEEAISAFQAAIAAAAGHGVDASHIVGVDAMDAPTVRFEVEFRGGTSEAAQRQSDSACAVAEALAAAAPAMLGGFDIAPGAATIGHAVAVAEPKWAPMRQTITAPAEHGGWLISVRGITDAEFTLSVELQARAPNPNVVSSTGEGASSTRVGVQDFSYALQEHVPAHHPLAPTGEGASRSAKGLSCGDFDNDEEACLLHCCAFHEAAAAPRFVPDGWTLPQPPLWLWGTASARRDGSPLPVGTEGIREGPAAPGTEGTCVPTPLEESLCAVELPNRDVGPAWNLILICFAPQCTRVLSQNFINAHGTSPAFHTCTFLRFGPVGTYRFPLLRVVEKGRRSLLLPRAYSNNCPHLSRRVP
jgi:hypothetical protein